MTAQEPSPGIDRVLVAGATGKTGRRLVRRLGDAPVTVRALTRSDAKRSALEDLGADEVVVGDLLKPGAADRAVADVDAVYSCVGSTPLQVHGSDVHVDGVGNENLVSAARDMGVEAFVMESSLGVDGDRGSWMARFFRSVIGPVVEAKTRAERAIRESGLRYTIFRPGMLVSYGDLGRVDDAGSGLWGVASRGRVARLMAAAPFTYDAIDRTFEVAANPLQRGYGLSMDWRGPEMTA